MVESTAVRRVRCRLLLLLLLCRRRRWGRCLRWLSGWSGRRIVLLGGIVLLVGRIRIFLVRLVFLVGLARITVVASGIGLAVVGIVGIGALGLFRTDISCYIVQVPIRQK